MLSAAARAVGARSPATARMATTRTISECAVPAPSADLSHAQSTMAQIPNCASERLPFRAPTRHLPSRPPGGTRPASFTVTTSLSRVPLQPSLRAAAWARRSQTLQFFGAGRT
ncbi:hypothetical protein TRVL_02446 [Trypanosoma vivax]|nr:hypothetical protein TRVL_02446 [Trypanosoma vivax]